MLLAKYKRKSFLHRIVTGDEKWIYFKNPKHKRSWVTPGDIDYKAKSLWTEDNALCLGSERCDLLLYLTVSFVRTISEFFSNIARSVNLKPAIRIL